MLSIIDFFVKYLIMSIRSIVFSAVIDGETYSTESPVGSRKGFNLETREFYDLPDDEDEGGYIRFITLEEYQAIQERKHLEEVTSNH